MKKLLKWFKENAVTWVVVGFGALFVTATMLVNTQMTVKADPIITAKYVPMPVTITATVLGNTYAANTTWTQASNSDAACSFWYAKETTGSYNLYYTFNNGYTTETGVDDFMVLAAGSTLSREGYCDTGVYFKVTYAASHAGGVAADVEVKFESWR